MDWKHGKKYEAQPKSKEEVPKAKVVESQGSSGQGFLVTVTFPEYFESNCSEAGIKFLSRKAEA